MPAGLWEAKGVKQSWEIFFYWRPLYTQDAEENWEYAEISCSAGNKSLAYLKSKLVGKFGYVSDAAKALNAKNSKVPADVKLSPWNKRAIAEELF